MSLLLLPIIDSQIDQVHNEFPLDTLKKSLYIFESALVLMSSSPIYRDCEKTVLTAGMSSTRRVEIKSLSETGRRKSSKSLEATNKKLSQRNKDHDREVAALYNQFDELNFQTHTKGND